MRHRAVMTLAPALFAIAILAAACGGGESSSTPTPPPVFASTADLIEELRPSVVHVQTEVGVGTGFIIDEEGHIVTNNHVITIDTIQPAEQITVTLADGSSYPASIVGRDRPTDLAVLVIAAQGLTPIRLGDSSQLRVGEDVVAIGHALNLLGGPTVTKGVVSALGRLIEESVPGTNITVTIPDAIQTDALINPGNSGGPLVNTRGQVVGITTAVIRGSTAEGIGLAISIDLAKPIVTELIEDGQVNRGFLGISTTQITPDLADIFDLGVDHGVGIQEVEPESPAERAGLQPGDIIVKIDETEIRNTGELFQALTKYRAGATVEIEFYRDGGLETTEITLSERP
ncbi:MAG: trypsin-like peptidase domain-containing protein [Dehalococcoidia bacterium]